MQLNESQIEQLRPLVETETGMDFSGSRFTRLSDAVEKVCADNRAVSDVQRLLADSHQRALFLEQLTAELTIGESFFFRNEHHFRALREEVIPDILRKNADRREIRIWSAGCAGGEEPYSLAILLDQILKKGTGPICQNGPQGAAHKLDLSPFSEWQTSILATDINTDFLRRARQAEYRVWSFRRTDIHQDPRYFTTSGDKSCLREDVRQRVRFQFLNLVKDVYPSPLSGTIGLDLILFRNVAIYLQPEVVRAIVARFFQCLHPGGWLLLGEAEVSQVQPEGFDVRRIGQASFFQKPAGSALSLTAETPRPVLPAAFGGAAVPPAPAAGPFAPAVERAARSAEMLARAAERAVPQAKKAADTISRRPEKTAPAPLPKTSPTVARDQPFDWQRIEQYLSNEDFESADRELAAIRDLGQRTRTTLLYVRRLFEVSQIARARQTLATVLAADPLTVEGHLLQACLAEERGELAEAESACRRALYLDRSCAIAHFHLGLIQQQRGDMDAARKSFVLVQKLAKSQDENALVAYGDGVCYGRLWQMAQSMIDS